MKEPIIQEVAAFLNSKAGGTVLIGVDNIRKRKYATKEALAYIGERWRERS